MHFVEYSSPAEYVRAAGSLAGPLPVLMPKSTSRQARWREVLAWYAAFGAADEASFRESASAGNVVAVGDAFQSVAHLLAHRAGQALRVIERRNLAAFLKGGAPPAITFVGAPDTLDAAAVRLIAAGVSVPWTVVTGRDLAAASFVAAKLLRLRSCRTTGGWQVLDAFAGTAARLASNGAVEGSEALSAATPDGDMTGGLVLHAHGEGAHADLNAVVLCGLSGEHETNPDGMPVPGGCRARLGDAFCKRRAPRHQRIVPFHALRTPRLVLLSCNGYSPHGETYASDVSAALGSLDGYVAEIVTSLRPLAFDDGVPLTCGRLGAREGGLAGVAGLAADLARREGFDDAIVRVGALAEPPADGMPEAWVRAGIHPLGAFVNSGVLAAPGAVARGGSIIVTPFSNSISPPLRDAEVDLRAFEERLLELRARMDRAHRWERGLAAELAEELPGARAGQLFSALLQASAALDEAAGLAEGTVLQSRVSGLLHAGLAPTFDLVDLAVADWDEAFARILSALRDASYPVAFYHGGWREPRLQRLDPCERCGATLEVRFLRLPFTPKGDARLTLCPNCGERDFLFEGEGSLEVVLPAEMVRSGVLRVRIEKGRGEAAQKSRPVRAWLVAHLRDKAGGAPMARRLKRLTAAGATLAFRVPCDCPPDLHSLKVTWIERLSVIVARRRIACVPPPASLRG